jgi:hypothetical protein
VDTIRFFEDSVRILIPELIFYFPLLLKNLSKMILLSESIKAGAII